MITQTKTTTSFLRNRELITSDHLDSNTESHGVINGLLGILSGRVEDGKETDELETVALTLMIITINLLESNGQGTETAHGEFLNVSLEPVLNFVGLVARAKLDDDAGHTLGYALELASRLFAVGTLSALVDGVKRLEVEDLDTSMSLGRVRDGTDNASVDGILIFHTGSVSGQLDNIIGRKGSVGPNRGAIDGEFVGGKGTSLVGTEDGDGSQLFDGSDTSDDGLVLGELLGTDGERDRQDGGHCDGNTADQEDEDVVETIAVTVVVGGVEDEDLEKDEDTDGDETEGTDLSENLLQVTGSIIILTDQRSGATEESVGTCGDDDTLGFTLLTGRTAEKVKG